MLVRTALVLMIAVQTTATLAFEKFSEHKTVQCGDYSKSRWSFDDLQNKVFVIDRKEAVSPFAKNHFFFCLLFKESFLVGLLRVHIKKVEVDNHYILLYTLEN